MRLKDAFKNNKVMLCILLIFALYMAGAILINPIDVDSLAQKGIISAKCESDNSVIKINGVGNVLTYRSVYLASLLMLIIAPLVGILLFKGGSIGDSDSHEQIGWIILANCVLGVLLLSLTSKCNIPSTILFWLGIFVAIYLRSIDKPKEY